MTDSIAKNMPFAFINTKSFKSEECGMWTLTSCLCTPSSTITCSSYLASLFPFVCVCVCVIYVCIWASLAQLVKNPPTMQETLVQFLGQEVLLEKG